MTVHTPHNVVPDYIAHGWKLCAIPPGTKGPDSTGWNKPENALEAPPAGHDGVGLLHAFSGTASLDIDALEGATLWLRERGVDLQQLLDADDAVQIVSGNPGHAKLLYALPFPMPSKKITVAKKTILEFRCASSTGLSVQDCLPPTVHPSGSTYRWAGKGNWKQLPMIPDEVLAIWSGLVVKDGERHIPAGDKQSPASVDELTSALHAVDPSCDRDTWVAVGMALASVDTGMFDVWNDWSQGSPKYPGQREALKQWQSFKPEGGIQVGTLFHHAFAAGWKRPPASVPAGMFGPVQQPQQEQDPIWPGGWEWESPVDILDDAMTVPPYDMTAGHLPKSYEQMMEANYRYHLHATREAYAGFFTVAVDMHLRPSVTVEERPGAAANGGTMYALVDQVGLAGPSTKGKTATLMHAVGHERGGSLLNAWNGREQAAVLKKMDAAIADIRAKHPGDDKVAAEKIKALKASTPVPDIVNSKITDKSLIATIASNVIHDLPTNLVIDEWENVYGGAAYRRDGGNSISDIHRKMFDGEAYSDKAQGTGKISAEETLGSLAFACTPEDMARWNGYEAAMSNGDMARKSLYAPGAPFDGERDQSIDFGAISEWRRIQRVLESLHDVKMTLESDPDFDRRVDKVVEEFGRQADGGDHVARWLAKSRIRMARMAARLWLVEQIEVSHVPSGTVTIPKAYRRRAWKYLTEFAWPHQIFVHNRLIGGESFKAALQILLRRIYANKLTTIKRDDLAGNRASVSMKRGGDDFIKVLLSTYHWIRPKVTRKMTGVNLNRPWEAHQFEVNPMLCSVYRKYDDELLRQHEVAKGQIRNIFDREDF